MHSVRRSRSNATAGRPGGIMLRRPHRPATGCRQPAGCYRSAQQVAACREVLQVGPSKWLPAEGCYRRQLSRWLPAEGCCRSAQQVAASRQHAEPQPGFLCVGVQLLAAKHGGLL